MLLFCSLLAMTQEIRVTGKVTSSEDGLGIPGASVTIKGTTIGTVTDLDGNYAINVPSVNSILVFSFIGMKQAEVAVGSLRVIDITLDPVIVGLDELVVFGYGAQRKRDVTGSIATVRSESFGKTSIPSIDRAIQGRAAGVQVTASSGIPGGAVSVVIRGIGSFGSIAPLYIIDGVQVQTGNPSRMLTSSNTLSGLNFDDIESIDVLKDASATAIYGSRGANGVVIITTKRGREQDGGKTRFDFYASRGRSTNIKTYDVLSGPEWIELDLEAFRNRWGTAHVNFTTRRTDFVNRGWLGYDAVTDTYDYSLAPTYDWQSEIYKPGNIQDYRLSASGGTRTKFFISGSYNHTDGHVITSYFNRGTLRVNLDHEVNKKLSIENSTSISVYGQNTVSSGGAFANPVRSGWQVVPMNPIYNEDGSYFGQPNLLFGTLNFNVVGDTYMNYNKGYTTKIIQSNAINWKITDNLRFRGFIGADVNDVIENQLWDPRTGNGRATAGNVFAYQTRFFIWQSSNTLSYNKRFGEKHDVGALAGFEISQRLFTSLSAEGQGLPNYKFNILGTTATPTVASAGYSDFKMAGFFGRLNYTFDDKYIATFTVRADGNSRFGIENRWGTFPSGAFAWRISSEPFMGWAANFLDDLKIRVSYGIAGADAAIGDFTARGLFAGGPDYLGLAGMSPSVLPNNFLTWEESKTTNLGLSLVAFRGRILFDFDVYSRISSELLLSRPLPPSTGWSSIAQNIGEMKNEGIEFTLNTVNIQKNKFTWSTDFNISLLRNEITKLLPGQDYLDTRTKVGQSLNDWYIFQYAGVNPADGRPMYYDKNGDITYIPKFEDRAWFGPQVPTRYGGITNTFSFGGFSFSFFLQYSGGNYRNLTEKQFGFRSGNTGDRNQFQYVFDDRWKQPGDMTYVPRPMNGNVYGGSPTSFYGLNSWSLENMEYLRLKDINITYNLPKSLVSRVGLGSLQIFGQATNMLTWTKYRGLDPEFTGDDFGVYPQGKVVTFGVKSSF